jgi:glycine dehydrogenase subunit 1
MGKRVVYPYIANSVPEIKERMLEEIGLKSIDEIYAEIPEHLQYKGRLSLPEPLLSECELKRHVEKILARNKTCQEYLNFLGAGTWQHYVPEVCNTINSRDEFLTAYSGEYYADHGKGQALFEAASMIGELVEMDVVNTPTYDWGMAAGFSIRMAARITGRNEVLLCSTISPERLLAVKNFCKSSLNIELVSYHKESGQLDLVDLKQKVTPRTAAIYFENPSYLGFVEEQCQEIAGIAHQENALCIVGVDPITLGVLEAPGNYGADIVCGDLQPLGINMFCGGGLAGFVATRDEKKYVAEYPSILVTLTETKLEGEYGFGGFGQVMFERTSYASRDRAKDFVGTEAALWGITAGVYLALLGPQGMQELGETILQRARYAAELLSEIKGVRAPLFTSFHFKEFIVNFDGTGKTVAEINRALLKDKIFGGKDLSGEFPELGNSALYCVTEIHTKEDIERLYHAVKNIVG